MGTMNKSESRVLEILSIGPAMDIELHSISGSKGHPGKFFHRLVRYGMVERTRKDKYKITEDGRKALQEYNKNGFFYFDNLR